MSGCGWPFGSGLDFREVQVAGVIYPIRSFFCNIPLTVRKAAEDPNN